MSRIAAIASKKDVAPVFCSKFRSQWSSGIAAAAYVLVLPGAGFPASAGQTEKPAHQTRDTNSRETVRVTVTATPPKAVVVVTGTLDLGKIKLADFGDVEPANR